MFQFRRLGPPYYYSHSRHSPFHTLRPMWHIGVQYTFQSVSLKRPVHFPWFDHTIELWPIIFFISITPPQGYFSTDPCCYVMAHYINVILILAFPQIFNSAPNIFCHMGESIFNEMIFNIYVWQIFYCHRCILLHSEIFHFFCTLARAPDV